MKMIDVLNMVAEGKIKEGTNLKKEDLNQEVELIPPKEKKY